MDEEMNKDFVVEYSPRWCHIEDISDASCETLEQYKQGFKKHKRRCPDANFGDFFYWNNSGWAIVKARSARDALNKYFIQALAYDTARQKENTIMFLDEFIGYKRRN
ncbi:MAG: hypothetical protein J6Y02_11810 [Pseudobutyrivibrio sp.]|nr:hypothetical protein [Pseudobutyrivibrio sp.]